MDKWEVEYVIYCRKSTDESSDNQKQSIPDQIKTCIDYAKREWLKIKEKPKDFSLFENENELEKENNESELLNRKIFLDTRNLFIVKEQETWKVPWKRLKWNNLIKKIKKWEIKWLLSYSPDRQARNMLEWWELINCVDEDLVTLKYANFHFENNASWKMMLGIWFVFSKQYSDKLSEDVSRWNKSKVEQWKAIWNYKAWYFINNEWFHEPHPEYFSLIKEAFKMKLDWEKESKIKDYLNANSFWREFKKDWRKSEMSKTLLNKIFRDEFYYGMFINWDAISNLREMNKYYKPIITEEQFQILKDRYNNNPVVKTKSENKDIYDDIRVFDNDFIICDSTSWLTFSLPSKNQRFEPKIEEANKKWIKLELKDLVESHQIKYRCSKKKSEYYWLTFTQEDIDKEIIKVLNNFNVWEKDFKEYINFTNTRLKDIIITTKEKQASINLEIWRLKNKKEWYIKNNMSIKKDEDETLIYEKSKKDFDKKIEFLRKQVKDLDDWERNEIVELEVFIDMLNNAKNYYKKASYVQKRKIVKILFLNIKINTKKELVIQIKPELQTLFNSTWWTERDLNPRPSP
ncbi:MAG: resolvase protein [uncultured bacterium (gcode 4)]|uniref:Resolvase protein n=1 Tax=uncultured bacterium (gcode 4) TaxID=1234023 RepID=K2AWG3_9BACT|nr:MAG: resolvase protein [uncultured bacterium (gcode 4)]